MPRTKQTFKPIKDVEGCRFRLPTGDFTPTIDKLEYREYDDGRAFTSYFPSFRKPLNEIEMIINCRVDWCTVTVTVPMTVALKVDRWFQEIVPLELIQFAAWRRLQEEVVAALRVRKALRMDPPRSLLRFIRYCLGNAFIRQHSDVGILYAREPSEWEDDAPLSTVLAPEESWRIAGPKLLALHRLPGALGVIIRDNLWENTPWVFFD